MTGDVGNMDDPGMERLLISIPLLRELPAELLLRIESSELFLPDHELAAERDRLEHALDAHIMTYRADAGGPPTPGRIHLCGLLISKTLAEPELALLLDVEQRFACRGVRLVAYERPLRYHSA